MSHLAPVTANRRTRLALDITETTVGRREWNLTRTAAEIQRDRSNVGADAPKSENVWFVGGEAWILKPVGSELAELNRTDAAPPLTSSDVNLAPGFESLMMFRRSDDLPGIGASGGTVAAGFNAFMKTVGNGISWAAAQLVADAAALPQVVTEVEDGDDNYPIDRVLSGKVSYPERAPFALRWYLPDDFSGSDAFLIFYFGGPADVTPDGKHGGQFALSLRGGGTARLYELDPSMALPAEQWRRRMEWKYSDPGGFKGRYETMFVVPYGRNRIEFRSAGVSFTDFGNGFAASGALAQMLLASLTMQRARTHLWKDLPAITGHSHQQAATGTGNVRMDVGREKRVPFSITRMKYPAIDPGDRNGVVVDAPFFVPWTLDAGTPFTLHADAYLPDNTSVLASIFNAADDTLCPTDANGNYLSVLGQQEYYVKIALASVDGTQTPVFTRYQLSVESEYQTNTRTPNTAAPVTRVGIQYQDIDPSTESADLTVRDILNACPILRQRDGIRSMLQVMTENGSSLVSNLFEGITTSAQSIKKGTYPETYPSENWRDVELRLTGMWERLEETLVLSLYKFGKDYGAGLTPNGEDIPWKVTDAIRKLFNHAGFNDDDLDIPDLPIRLWATKDGLTEDDWTPAYGTSYGSVIRRLAWDFLRMVIVRDVNCRSGQYEGKWRLIQNPVAPYTNILASFYITNPGNLTGKMPHMLGSYSVGDSYIRRDTWREWVVRPECNYVVVVGIDKNEHLYWGIATNQASIDDPNSPDYIGRMVPVFFPPDPTLASQAAVDWACRIIYDAAAHSQKWCSFEAPLLLVTDATDTLQVRPRPLRVNDLIQIEGLNAVVRDVRIDYDHDTIQMMNVEALFLTDVAWSAAAASSQTTLRRAVASMVGASQGARPGMMPPVFEKQIMGVQRGGHHINLPPQTGSRQALQDGSGNFYYMMDYDPLDGGAPLN